MNIPETSNNQIKRKILRILRQDQKATAESLLCREVRITPESLRKQILELQESGYEIRTTGNGFQLIHEPDNPYPWEFPGRESFIHYYKELSSTMDVAREMAGKGCPDFTVIISEFQRIGRGRLQRTWHSDAGGLYFTIVLRPKLAPVHSHRINFAASLVLAKVLQQLFHVDAKVKWPNDILVNNLKLSGMLSEMGVEADKLSYVNIGIGINVNNDPTGKEPNAVSLKKLLGTSIDRRKLLSSFLDSFQTAISGSLLENIIPQWKQYTMTIGRQVKIVTIKESYEGFARDINENGALILEQKDGSLIEVIYGDCFHG
jgi:BirA family transcriptional regulator, biotin operon repressor / biotin---[acetyl-CoA-carboxylase] ligase